MLEVLFVAFQHCKVVTPLSPLSVIIVWKWRSDTFESLMTFLRPLLFFSLVFISFIIVCLVNFFNPVWSSWPLNLLMFFIDFGKIICHHLFKIFLQFLSFFFLSFFFLVIQYMYFRTFYCGPYGSHTHFLCT